MPALLQHAPKHFTRYIEPFAGSACFFFSLSPKTAIISDINNDLISAYQCVRDDPDRLHRLLETMPSGRVGYLAIRSETKRVEDSFYQAARFIYLNRFCFNGLYRTNKAGRFNVPYGGERSGTLPTLDELRLHAEAFSRVQFCSGSFERVVNVAREGDFVYMDPPYRVESRRIFAEYSAMEFSENNLVALRSLMVRLDSIGVNFLVSYAVSPEANLLRRGFNSVEMRVRRNIAGFAASRRKSREVFIFNYSP